LLKANFFALNKKPKILCLGAHSDDIEIGCGASLLRLIEEFSNPELCWVVFSGNERRQKEAVESAAELLVDIKKKRVLIKSFRESYFPYIGEEIKDYFEEIADDFNPDIIFTHFLNDAHQDHRLISHLTWNTFRDHLIFEYEIPKYENDQFTPNVYMTATSALVQKKINMVINNFPSQKEKKWFNEATFRAVLTLRGNESNSPTGYSEAFHCRKIIA
jgi:LmbE family N-acetylglucosaminyl deacetylase